MIPAFGIQVTSKTKPLINTRFSGSPSVEQAAEELTRQLENKGVIKPNDHWFCADEKGKQIRLLMLFDKDKRPVSQNQFEATKAELRKIPGMVEHEFKRFNVIDMPSLLSAPEFLATDFSFQGFPVIYDDRRWS